MSNTFATLNTELLATETLKACVRQFPMISSIGTNFAPSALYGQTVKVSLPAEVNAAAWTKANGYQPQDSTNSEVEVTLDNHIHVTRQIDVQEAHSTDMDLIAQYAELDAASIVKPMIADLIGKVVDPDVPTATQQTVSAVGAFGRDTLVDINTALRLRDVSHVGRYLVLNPEYYGALTKDQTLINSDTNPGNGIVASSEVFTADGTSIQTYNGVTDNGENLVGFSGVGESFGIATRIPTLGEFDGAGFNNYRETIVSEATSGLSMAVVEYVDPGLGCFVRSYRLMFGTAIGNAKTIQKLASS